MKPVEFDAQTETVPPVVALPISDPARDRLPTGASRMSQMIESLAMPERDTAAEQIGRRLRLRVPREDGTLYAVPPLEGAPGMARDNHAQLAAATVDIQGRRLDVLRAAARRDLCRAARDYTGTWTDVPPCTHATELVYVTGHQPLLFHPGVWVKNFVAARLAETPQALGINLVVDNDTFSSAALRIPLGDRARPRFGVLPFDDGHPARPWEGAEILNRTLFENFGNSVVEAMKPWGIRPLIEELWPLVLERAQQSNQLADCFTAARNQLERRWGVENLELPISRMCDSETFLWFVSHIVAQLPRFRTVYNEALTDYREANKVRSRTHPVPELKRRDDWLEAPFWIWRDGSYDRRRVFARPMGKQIELSDGRDVFATVPLTPDGEACCAVEALRELPARGLRLRTRALTTTLFARLCLADLFLHGIGGAKYDEMTDRIIARFYGLTPPSFMAVSATVLLPLGPHAAEPADVARTDAMLRDLKYNPEKYFDETAAERFAPLAAEKQRLLAESAAERAQSLPRRQRRENRHHRAERGRRIREITESFAAAVAPQAEQIIAERNALDDAVTANKVLNSREFSFALYPEDKLRSFMTAAGADLAGR